MEEQWWLPPTDQTETVTELFRRNFGGDPAGVWAAPGRINLIGEHIDYNDGCCLPCALPHRTYAAISPRSERTLRLISDAQPDDGSPTQGPTLLDRLEPGATDGWAAYPAGVIWAMREAGVDVPGLDVAISSSVPLGAGLSSSAALECAVALAVAQMVGLPTDEAGRKQLAQWCVTAENTYVGANTGGMDQAAVLLCRSGHALLLDTRSGDVDQLDFDPARVGLEILVVDTGVHHTLVDGQYASRRADCEQAVSLLGVNSLREVNHLESALAQLRDRTDDVTAERLSRRVRHVVSEMERVSEAETMLRAAEVAPLGPLLTASHASLRDDYEVSVPELDLAVETAVAAGALGARMIGGGFGGSMIALVPTAEARSVAQAVQQAFTTAGLAAPAFLEAPTSDGAQRVR